MCARVCGFGMTTVLRGGGRVWHGCGGPGLKMTLGAFSFSFFPSLKKDFTYLFLERGEKREKEAEKHQCVVASQVPTTGDLACNWGMCPDWELNWRPLDSKAGTQSSEPHQPGLSQFMLRNELIYILEVLVWAGPYLFDKLIDFYIILFHKQTFGAIYGHKISS